MHPSPLSNCTTADSLVVYLSAQTEEPSRAEIPPGVRPRRGAPDFRERLQCLVRGQHAVNGKAIEYALHLRQFLDRPEGFESFVVAIVIILAPRRLFVERAACCRTIGDSFGSRGGEGKGGARGGGGEEGAGCRR